jgi:hypothetical protein
MSRMCARSFTGYAFPSFDSQENTMKIPRKGTSDTATENAPTRGKRQSERSRRGKTKAVGDANQRPNSKLRDLPPNENIRKSPDEVYGDTEIPERKPGT